MKMVYMQINFQHTHMYYNNIIILCRIVYDCMIFLYFYSELPYGWEKVNDPVYGTYYIE